MFHRLGARLCIAEIKWGFPTQRSFRGDKPMPGFVDTAKDFAVLSQTRLTIPVLTVGGEKSLGEFQGAQLKLVASDVTVVVLKDTGHWVLEERPQETTAAMLAYLQRLDPW